MVKVAWDDEKYRANLRAHGIGFAEAGKLFSSGVDYLEIFDAEQYTKWKMK